MNEDNKYVNMLEDICEKCSHYDGSYCDYYKQNLYKGVSCSHFEKPLKMKRNNNVSFKI